MSRSGQSPTMSTSAAAAGAVRGRARNPTGLGLRSPVSSKVITDWKMCWSAEMVQPLPGLEGRRVGEDGQADPAAQQLGQGRPDVRIEDEVGVAHPPVVDDPGGEDLRADTPQLSLRNWSKTRWYSIPSRS